jgi:hypothetical protein
MLKADEWSSYDEEKHEAMLAAKLTELELTSSSGSSTTEKTDEVSTPVVNPDNREIFTPAIDTQPDCPVCFLSVLS